MEEDEPHDAHVVQTKKMFRDVGYDLPAIQYKASDDATNALKRFNGLPPEWKHPVAWGYHPNPGVRDYWEKRGREERLSAK